MNRFLALVLLSIFAIFVGSQITEGIILLPYWKSMSADNFYTYYAEFGPEIGWFYSILTVVAALICIGISIYCHFTKSKALKFSLISSLFAMVFILMFYIYFKDTNQLFYDAALTSSQLEIELYIWGVWHWCRVGVEVVSLIFLACTFILLSDNNVTN